MKEDIFSILKLWWLLEKALAGFIVLLFSVITYIGFVFAFITDTSFGYLYLVKGALYIIVFSAPILGLVAFLTHKDE